uniref:FCH and mu domain containing endocytic adaptor 1 n=1 Tax=Sinocyclocheilus anshuiensis TaxID=1608454 RepID=A0A671QLU4_9TELE
TSIFGEKNAGFDILYHNMKHGQIATKELAEFVRERVAIEETYSKSMSKLAKIASNGSPLGTFAPMWDVFRVSSDKLALCHLELMRKMNDLIRDINKYSEEQVKIHRKTKEEVIGTLESVQSLQVQNTHLQKARERYHSKCVELERLHKEGMPQKELEKAELKSKKAAGSFAGSIEKFNRTGRDFEQKMSESAQKFQDIEEAHLRQMKLLIKAYSHSIEDTHVQVGQVHEEFKQNVENIGIENLIQKFTDQKGTGKERPGESQKDKTISPEIAFLFYWIEKEGNFYSSDSDFDDDEPKKFHIQIRPVASSNRSNSAANELELKATVGALTLPPNRAVRGGDLIESWPVAAAITEYINAYFKGGEHNCCLVKITGDLTMSFPAGIIRIFTANPNAPVLSFRLVNICRVDHFLPNQKLLYSDPSQSDPDTKDFWFNMPALTLHLQREAELNPQASYYNVALLKYQASSQDPGRAPLLLSAECQRSGTVTRVSLDYHCCPATGPASQLTSVQVLLPLDHTATDLQCQPPASWNAEERRLLWKLSNLSPTNHRSGTLCASWQCLEVPRGPPPSLAVQFVGSGASLAGLDVKLVGSCYRMSLVKKRFATGGSQTYYLSLISSSFQFRIVYSVGYLVTRWLLGSPLDGCFLV